MTKSRDLSILGGGYTQNGTGAEQRSVEDRLKDFVSVRDFGAVCDGTTPDTAAIQEAIDYAFSAGRSTVIIPQRTAIDGTVYLKPGVTLNSFWSTISVKGDFDAIIIPRGGQLKDTYVDCVGVPTFSNTAVKLLPGNPMQGDQYLPWASGVKVRFGGSTGVGFEIDAEAHYVQLTTAENLSVRFGERGIYYHAGGGGTWCNGNLVNGYVCMASTYSIWLQQHAGGNIFDGLVLESNNNATVRVESGANVFHGVAWDDVGIQAEGNGNYFGFIQTVPYGPNISGSGIDNRSFSSTVRRDNNVSTNKLEDHRHGVYEPGRVEFRDFFIGGADPKWNQTVNGDASVQYLSQTYGANSDTPQTYPVMRLNTGTVGGGGSVVMDFNQRPAVITSQKPIVHFTLYNDFNDDRTAWTCGLRTDPDNFIILTQNLDFYGDDDIRFVCRSGGISTVEVLLNVASFQQINFVRMLVSPASVNVQLAQYARGAGNDAGKVGRGIRCFDNNLLKANTTITTNIPTTSLAPYILATATSNNPGYVELIDYQLIAGRQALT